MKTKKLTIFSRIFSIFMIFCFAFLCVGCMGNAPSDDDSGDDEFEDLLPDDGNNPFDGPLFDMYGTRVLYRPEEYDFDKATGAQEGQTNDYYGKFSWLVLNELLNTYAFADSASIEIYLPEFAPTGSQANDKVFLYDSIRYKTNTIGTVNKIQTGDSTTDLDSSAQHIIVGANTTESWNWSFDYDTSSIDETMNAILVDTTNAVSVSSQYYNPTFANLSTFATTAESKYSDTNFKAQYQTIYLGTQTSTDTENYSDYVKALEYIIYCYALGITPGEVDVTINENPSSTNPEYYTVKIIEDNGQTQLTASDALTAKKTLFKKHGSYVGLTETNMQDISTWIAQNVIGVSGKITNDNMLRYGSVTKVDGATPSYTFSPASLTSAQLGRNYSQVVSLIMNNSAKQVSIGKVGEVDVTIDQPYLASEVTEYEEDSFFIAGDENFPTSGFDRKGAIKPLEYQSVTLMLREPLKLSEIWIALKYDADEDGTEDGVWDATKFLDIIVELNYFHYNDQNPKVYKLGSKRVQVYDGPFDIWNKFPDPIPSDNGVVSFGDFETSCPDAELKAMLDDGNLNIGSFNYDIGKLSENPMLLTGSTDVRTYYALDISSANELGEGKEYRTGKVNSEKYSGAEGCDYLEITYKVIKNPNDFNTNYKFYTGIAAMFDAFEW